MYSIMEPIVFMQRKKQACRRSIILDSVKLAFEKKIKLDTDEQ